LGVARLVNAVIIVERGGNGGDNSLEQFIFPVLAVLKAGFAGKTDEKFRMEYMAEHFDKACFC
jgi:hypothetical protein